VHIQYILIQSTEDPKSYKNIEYVVVEEQKEATGPKGKKTQTMFQDITSDETISNALVKKKMPATELKKKSVWWGNEDEQMILYAQAMSIIQDTLQSPLPDGNDVASDDED
jgi:hypothetical protein